VGCAQAINPAAEALTGWTPAEAVGRDLLDVHQALVIREGAASRTGRVKIPVAWNGTETMVREIAGGIVNGAGNIPGVLLVMWVEGAS
jgi:PAS domain-containing protein